MTLLQLELFVAVCEVKSFTRAAETLHMTQSAVSQAILSLESELGVRLIERDRHNMTVTQIGERVLSHARSMMQHTLELKQEAQAAAGIERGTLRIGVSRGLTARLFPRLLHSFQARHPACKVTAFDGTYDELNNALANHRVDVSFTVLQEKRPNSVGLMKDRFMLLARKDHRLGLSEAISFVQIQDESVIQLKMDGISVVSEALKREGIKITTDIQLGDPSALLELVQQGVGVAILPELAFSGCPPEVVAIPFHPVISRNVGLVVRDMNRVSPLCADFLLHAQEYVANTREGC